MQARTGFRRYKMNLKFALPNEEPKIAVTVEISQLPNEPGIERSA
jgi:hypothetical protein